VPPSCDFLELHVSHFTDTTLGGVEMASSDDDADVSKMGI